MKITITGDRAEGKTQLAAIIADYLDKIGYETNYVGHNRYMVEEFTNMKKNINLSQLNTRTVHIMDNENGR